MKEERALDDSTDAVLVPAETGAEDEQDVRGPSALVPPASFNPADQKHMGAALSEHVGTRSPAVMTLAVAAFEDARESRNVLSKQLARISDELNHTRSLYHEEVKARAVLSTKLDLLSQFDRFRQWGTRVGALLSGVGLTSAVQTESLHFTEILLLVAGLGIMAISFWAGRVK